MEPHGQSPWSFAKADESDRTLFDVLPLLLKKTIILPYRKPWALTYLFFE